MEFAQGAPLVVIRHACFLERQRELRIYVGSGVQRDRSSE